MTYQQIFEKKIRWTERAFFEKDFRTYYKNVNEITNCRKKGSMLQGLTDANNVKIADKKEELKIVKEHYEEILWDEEAI
jgi:hypothetical protein